MHRMNITRKDLRHFDFAWPTSELFIALVPMRTACTLDFFSQNELLASIWFWRCCKFVSMCLCVFFALMFGSKSKYWSYEPFKSSKPIHKPSHCECTWHTWERAWAKGVPPPQGNTWHYDFEVQVSNVKSCRVHESYASTCLHAAAGTRHRRSWLHQNLLKMCLEAGNGIECILSDRPVQRKSRMTFPSHSLFI